MMHDCMVCIPDLPTMRSHANTGSRRNSAPLYLLIITSHQTFNKRNNDRNTRKMCQICSKSPIKKSEYQTFGVFIIDFDQIPNLGVKGGGGNYPPPSSWFSLNNSKKVRAVTLDFCSIQ